MIEETDEAGEAGDGSLEWISDSGFAMDWLRISPTFLLFRCFEKQLLLLNM